MRITHLRMAEFHAALAYYFDHTEEIMPLTLALSPRGGTGTDSTARGEGTGEG